MDQLEAHRRFFANLITGAVGIRDARLIDAIASTPREQFVGPGPWKVFTAGAGGYIETPTDHPTLLYHDITVALMPERLINNGQPTLHAISIGALGVKDGETVVHVGSGSGYYTAILTKLVGPQGTVHAYELEPELAARATANLAQWPNVAVHQRSGAEAPLPLTDVIYVSAGATGPVDAWLDSLPVGGRLLFPMTPAAGVGGMLLVARMPDDTFKARFVCQAMFIPCIGARDEETAQKLTAAFKAGRFTDVRSVRRGGIPDETCWCAGNGWWLSTAEADSSQ